MTLGEFELEFEGAALRRLVRGIADALGDVAEKIEAGLVRALEKRPIAKQEFRALVAAIERDISVLNRPEVKTADIGEIIMRRLKELDKVAYIRFASVYRAFTDVGNFREEIKRLTIPKKRSPVRLKNTNPPLRRVRRRGG